ncbi:Ribonuclease HII [Clostridium luticellarii]|uniref:Ribonuclease HII n=3 Tax=Clostridium luticellarii TaxID=1691940 RepID=A0A2T0BR96_9CLOT|nr:Ribonuclease HII [Clostridium luticellarii]
MMKDKNNMEMDNFAWSKLAIYRSREIKDEVDCLKKNYSNLKKDMLLKILDSLRADSRKNVRNLAANFHNFIENRKSEIERIKAMYSFDKKFGNYVYTAGVDEVGRGPLAGPIAAAAVILNLNCREDGELILGIKDSKKLSPKRRCELSEAIKHKALGYNISVINNTEIDKRGIAWCNNEVLKRAVEGLKLPVDMVLSDGYPIKHLFGNNEFIIKGDAKSASIAAASIVAKVYRDSLMKEYSHIYAEYGFQHNSGYGTKEHIEAIKKYGVCKIHRMSFLKNIIM